MMNTRSDNATRKPFQFRYWHLLCLVVLGSGAVWAGYTYFSAQPELSWMVKIRRDLIRKASLEFTDTPLSEALLALQETLGGTILHVDSQVEEKYGETMISMKFSETSAAEILERLLDGSGLSYDLIDHVVFVAEGQRLKDVRLFTEARFQHSSHASNSKSALMLRKRLARPMSVCWVDTPLDEALNFFESIGQIQIVLDDSISGFRDARLNGNFESAEQELSLESALAWTVRLVGLEYEIRGDSIFVSVPDKLGGKQ